MVAYFVLDGLKRRFVMIMCSLQKTIGFWIRLLLALSSDVAKNLFLCKVFCDLDR